MENTYRANGICIAAETISTVLYRATEIQEDYSLKNATFFQITRNYLKTRKYSILVRPRHLDGSGVSHRFVFGSGFGQYREVTFSPEWRLPRTMDYSIYIYRRNVASVGLQLAYDRSLEAARFFR